MEMSSCNGLTLGRCNHTHRSPHKIYSRSSRYSQQSLSLLNTETSKVVLQNRTDLDITASQGATCAIIQTECCVFIPGKYANTSSLLTYMETQINALSDPTPSLGNLLTYWFGS